MAAGKRIVVIGSANMDLIVRTPRVPAPGETVLGDHLVTLPGGKGANQAVAAAKLAEEDTEVFFVGRMGDDDFGAHLLTGLAAHHVNTEFATVTEGASSGAAVILVDKRGENSIVVAPGANALLSPADVDRAERAIAGASAVVLQLEIPLATVAHAIALCQRLGVYTILDPAPVPPKGLGRALYGVDVLTPNQREAEQLAGLPPGPRSRRSPDAKQIGSRLLARGAVSVVIKLGAKGALLVGRDEAFETVRPFKVKVVDTTAAGDAFTGALAVARARGMPLEDAVRFANAAGAVCCQSFGAQPALPDRVAVDALLAAAAA